MTHGRAWGLALWMSSTPSQETEGSKPSPGNSEIILKEEDLKECCLAGGADIGLRPACLANVLKISMALFGGNTMVFPPWCGALLNFNILLMRK